MEANWSNGEQCWKVAATSQRSNVATSPRRDVPTSRRPQVATFQRRDVPTSRRWVNRYRSQQSETSRCLNFTTLQRRDVSTGSAPHHLKHQWLIIEGIGRRTNEGTEFQSSNDTDFEEVPMICTVSHFFWILE